MKGITPDLKSLIQQEAEKQYKTLMINLVAGMPASDFNHSERKAFTAGAEWWALTHMEGLLNFIAKESYITTTLAYEKETLWHTIQLTDDLSCDEGPEITTAELITLYFESLKTKDSENGI